MESKSKKSSRMIITRILFLAIAMVVIMLLPSCRGKNKDPQTSVNSTNNEAAAPLPPEPFSVEDSDTVWYRVDCLPVFSDNPDAMIFFLRDNIRYPEEAKKKRIQGRVVVGFVLTRDCKVKNAKIITGIGPECDNEALRVVNALPEFAKPAYINNRPVNYHYTLPVHYTLN